MATRTITRVYSTIPAPRSHCFIVDPPYVDQLKAYFTDDLVLTKQLMVNIVKFILLAVCK